MIRVADFLDQYPHPFKSVSVDSISEIQKRCKDQVRDLQLGEDMDQKRWGQLLDHMEWLVRRLRDLTEHPYYPVDSVVLTSMTHQRDGKWRPYVQGQLATSMPYFLDVIGYMFVAPVNGEDPTQAQTSIRRLLVEPHPMFEAGNRVQGRLPTFVDEPTITGMITDVFGPERNAA